MKKEPEWCEECGGTGEHERITGERQGMGGIEPIIKTRRCPDCDDGLAQCHDCDDTPAYKTDAGRLCQPCIDTEEENET